MKKSTFKLYKTEDGWRWNIVEKNGNILAASTEAYKNRAQAIKNIDRIGEILRYDFTTGTRGEVTEEILA